MSSEQLDAILIELRSRREQASRAKGRPAASGAPSPGASVAAPIAAPAPVVARPDPAAKALDGLRHLPKEAAEKLASLAASPLPAADAKRPEPTAATRAFTAGSELKAALYASRRAFVAAGVFSLVINLLMLAGPLFMLQVYDRVMTSGSMPTLVVLTVMTAIIYGIIGLLELVRSRVVVRAGVELDRRIGDRVFEASLRRSLVTQGAPVAALRELDGLRQFLGGPAPITLFDAPWTPIYLAVIFLTHWTLGLAALVGAVVLLGIAWASEQRTRAPLAEAAKAGATSIELAETGQRNAEALAAMGMLGAYRARWQRANAEALVWQVLASDRLGSLSSSSKALRLLMQSLMLAIGAALALRNEISAGAIVAATIIFGRALAPVEQAIGHWRSFVKAKDSYTKLDQLLRQTPAPAARTSLPAPKGNLEVGGLRVAAPDARAFILNNLTFAVAPGQVLAVIGPSASGKSTLARTLVGLWPALAGHVKLDGARLDQWNAEELGRHIGYLPQDVELFSGTVRENIARFRPDAHDEDVVEAARMAHAHDMILALPQGYETQLGNFGTYLSAGQRQRIGLARALFSRPALVVLDEPNSNLDRIGDEALASAIDGMRARGQTAVIVSHRVQAIGKADLVLYVDRGVQRAFGPRNDVLRAIQQAAAGDAAPPAQVSAPVPAPAQAPKASLPAAPAGAPAQAQAAAKRPVGPAAAAAAAANASAAPAPKPSSEQVS